MNLTCVYNEIFVSTRGLSAMFLSRLLTFLNSFDHIGILVFVTKLCQSLAVCDISWVVISGNTIRAYDATGVRKQKSLI